MPHCAFHKCYNSTKHKNKSHGITFHSFPADELWKHEWLKVLRKQRQEPYWTSTTNSRVCSIHFHPEHLYDTSKGRRRVTKGAVPYFQPVMTTDDVASSRSTSPNSLQNVDISDMESIFDSPRKVYLKRRLENTTRVKNRLLKENKNLKSKNKRLQKKCHSMNEAISNLNTTRVKNGLYMRSKIMRLKKKYRSLREAVLNLKKNINISDDQFREVLLKAEAADLYQRSARYKKSNKNNRMLFSPNLRKFALSLNFYSPMGYRYVRSVFKNALPPPRTLSKWYEHTNALPGFTAEAFDVLKKKHSASGERMLCTLMVDEMAIRRQPLWNGRKSTGLVNYGTGSLDTDQPASQAYVMLVVSLNQNWKLPVGYFFVDGLAAECRANLIKMCLTKCWDVGVDIVAMTFDGCRPNISVANLLGCQLDDVDNLKTTFKHPAPACNIDVAVFLDPSHMVKLVRDTFESKRMILDNEGRKIKWQFLVNLLKLQRSEALNYANKTTPRHVDFRNQIMKAELATRLLSRSVANALKLCDEMLVPPRFVNTDATVQFIECFNNIFDIMNSRERDGFAFKKPICPDNKTDQFNYFEKIKEYICSLQIFVKSRRIRRGKIIMKISKKKIVNSTCKTGFIGFIVCMESLKHLYSTLIENDRLKYIATYRLSQEHLQLLFGVIRRYGGHNNTPNVRQFQGIYRKILGHLDLRSSLSDNCIPLDNFSIPTCSSAIDNINQTIAKNVFNVYDLDTEEDTMLAKLFETGNLEENKVAKVTFMHVKRNKNKIEQSDETAEKNVEILNELLNNPCSLSISAEQIVGYIAGWVARALVKSIKCETCCELLVTCKKLTFHKLITLKDMGGLCYSSSDVYQICAKAENTVKLFIAQNKKHFVSDSQIIKLKINVMKSFVHSNSLSTLNGHSLDQPATLNHRLQLLKAITDKYCDVRLHCLHKIGESTKRQKRSKLSLF